MPKAEISPEPATVLSLRLWTVRRIRGRLLGIRRTVIATEGLPQAIKGARNIRRVVGDVLQEVAQPLEHVETVGRFPWVGA